MSLGLDIHKISKSRWVSVSTSSKFQSLDESRSWQLSKFKSRYSLPGELDIPFLIDWNVLHFFIYKKKLLKTVETVWVNLNKVKYHSIFLNIQGVCLVLSKVICFLSSFILPPGYYGGSHFFSKTGRFCYIDCKKFKCIVIIFKIYLCFQPFIRNIGKNTKKTQR